MKSARFSLRVNPGTAGLGIASVWGSVTLMVVAAPWLAARLAPGAAAMLYLLFSPVCHQQPTRSFSLCGHPLAVCQRCSGIYFGLFLGALVVYRIPFSAWAARLRRAWVAAGVFPLLADAVFPHGGFWTSTPTSRLLTGLAFGLMLSAPLVAGTSELLGKVARHPGTSAHLNNGDHT